MDGIEPHGVLAVVRWPATNRLRLLMDRVEPADRTLREVLALVLGDCMARL